MGSSHEQSGGVSIYNVREVPNEYLSHKADHHGTFVKPKTADRYNLDAVYRIRGYE